jgi:hypothetical protein
MDSDLYTDDQTYDISDVYFCNECFFARLLNCRLTHLILHLEYIFIVINGSLEIGEVLQVTI